MTTPAMDPCPFAPKKSRGAHCLSILVPPNAKKPATLFCDKCGMTKAIRLDFPTPADVLISEANEILAKRG